MRAKIDRQEILKLPLTTSRIKVSVDRDRFFDKYTIISYYGQAKDNKDLPYEQLADNPFLSVTGLWARWNESCGKSIRFFILAKKEQAAAILSSLREYDQIRSKIDTLEEYDSRLQQRIIASLVINSLGKIKQERMMYNDGSLLISDDKNFLVKKSRKELVCLKIEVNEYMNLTASTTSFSNPASLDYLKRKGRCVFKVSSSIDGQWFSGMSVKPVLLKDLDIKNVNLQDLYIKKKRFADNHNLVPYWPYNSEDYIHGKLFALAQVVDSANELYNPMVKIDFEDYQVIHYDEYKSKDDTLEFISSYFKNRSIYFDDPFNTIASKSLVNVMMEQLQEVTNQGLLFLTKPETECMTIKLCGPIEDDQNGTFYTKSLYRLANSSIPTQHNIFYDNEKEDTFDRTEARRILLELIVKDSLVRRTMPAKMANAIGGWKFYRWKIHEGTVTGAMLTTSGENIQMKGFGFPNDPMAEDIQSFAHAKLLFDDYQMISGARDYMAMKKDENVYLIIDTDEIPILDVALIDEGYGKVLNNGEPLALFKRKAQAHQYLRGYIGFHLWKTDGLYGEPEGAYGYIAGTNSESLQIKKGQKMDKMPRARRIFILHKENPELVEKQIQEICSMLKFGFGRWTEIMTYPFPFKFLMEFLDDCCEIAFSKHWSQLTYND